MSTTLPSDETLKSAVRNLQIAFPAPDERLEQDEEWVLVKIGDDWRKIRLHDYGEVYAVPGLYERWVYEIFQCQSPMMIRKLLGNALRDAGVDASSLTVLDLGAGNGYVAEELCKIDIERFVGLDIVEMAKVAADRDRPGLYADYVIGDLLRLDDDQQRRLAQHEYDVLTCVAALGFGDIPPEVFANACNRIKDDGWLAFTIKTDFFDEADQSGFSILIRRMLASGILELDREESYTHRVTADGSELRYEAFIGRKRGHLADELFADLEP